MKANNRLASLAAIAAAISNPTFTITNPYEDGMTIDYSRMPKRRKMPIANRDQKAIKANKKNKLARKARKLNRKH